MAEPLRNYQGLLRSVIEERLSDAASLQRIVAALVTADVESVPSLGDLLSIEVPPPVPKHNESRFSDQPGLRRSPARRNYLEVEARNQSLGRAGEQLVLRFEHERLWGTAYIHHQICPGAKMRCAPLGLVFFIIGVTERTSRNAPQKFLICFVIVFLFRVIRHVSSPDTRFLHIT